MKSVHCVVFAAVLAVTSAFPLLSQELSSPKIPRRVYFAPALIEQGINDPTLRMIPDYLYTAISSRQPIVRVENAAQANSVVQVQVSSPGPSVVVRLLEENSEVAKVSFVDNNFADLATYVDRTAADLVPHLGLVEPKAQQSSGTGQAAATGNQALIQKVRLADRFARPIELSVDGLGLMRFTPNSVPSGRAFGFDPTPVVLHFTYFTSRSLGWEASLFTYYGERITFGRIDNTYSSPISRSFLIMPGFGVKYRSLGTIYATFSGSLYAGYGHVKNVTSQTVYDNNQGVFLYSGQSRSIIYTLLRFSSGFGYNISPRLAAYAGITLDLSPLVFFGSNPLGYPTDGNSFYIQFLSLGLSYRP